MTKPGDECEEGCYCEGKQPIGARYLGHVTGYQPIRYQYFLVRSVLSFWDTTGPGSNPFQIPEQAINSSYIVICRHIIHPIGGATSNCPAQAEAGSYAGKGATSPTLCPIGTFAPAAKSASCTNCTEGNWVVTNQSELII